MDVNANPARYRQDELQAHAERLTALLTAFPRTGAGARAAALDACTPAERAAARTRGTGAPLDDGDGAADLVARFAACAARRPDRTAVRTADGSAALSYAELDASSDALAARLAAAGVGPEDRVAVALPRCAGFAVAALGVLKAGGCYVPLDPRWPAGRTRFVLADTAARAVIAEQGADRAAAEPAAGAAGVPVLPLAADGTGPDAPGPVPAPGGHPDRLAYAMYTSGSTGTPKGVAVTHRDVLAFTRDHRWALGDHSAVLAHSPHGFDLSVFELWMPLLTGGRVVVAPRGELDAPDWRELLATSGATALWLASGLFRVLAEEAPDCFTALERLWVGGDAVPPGAVRRVLAANPGLTVVNGYGPTETTVFATAHRVDRAAPPAATVPIGRPDLTYQERPRPLPVAEAAARYPD
ncbi:AMP-binding protein [Nocardiopsis composta]